MTISKILGKFRKSLIWLEIGKTSCSQNQWKVRIHKDVARSLTDTVPPRLVQGVSLVALTLEAPLSVDAFAVVTQILNNVTLIYVCYTWTGERVHHLKPFAAWAQLPEIVWRC